MANDIVGTYICQLKNFLKKHRDKYARLKLLGIYKSAKQTNHYS